MIGGTAPTQHRLCDATWLSPRDIACRLAATGRMADMDGVPEAEMVGELDHIGDMGVHVVAGVGLVERPCPRRSCVITR
jgi:hypothetical protein